MTGIVEAFDELAPGWPQLVWAFAVHVREENALRERSRVAPRVRRASTAPGGVLTLVQRQQAGKLRARGRSITEIANKLDVRRSSVVWYFEQKRRPP